MRRAIALLFVSSFFLGCPSSGGGGKDDGPADVPGGDALPLDLGYDTNGTDATVGEDGDTPVNDGTAPTQEILLLMDISMPIQVAIKQVYTIHAKVLDTASNDVAKSVAVTFKIVKVTDGLGGEELVEYDGSIPTGTSITDDTGRVATDFQAGESVGLVYTIEATSKLAVPVRFDLITANLDCASLKVGVTYDGNLSEASSYVVSVLSGETKCADLAAGNLPAPVGEASGTDFTTAVEVLCVRPDTKYTVFVTAKEACPFAAGCIEDVTSGAKDTSVEKTVDLVGVDVTMDGTYTGTHKFVLTDLFPDCGTLLGPTDCASPQSLPFPKLACCYLGAIEGFFKSGSADFATAILAGADSWEGTKVASGQKAAFDSAVNTAMTEYLAADTPDWVAGFRTIGAGVQAAVRQVNLTSTITLAAADGDGKNAGSVAWAAYGLYWKVGCDPADPNYFQCGKCSYAMDRFGGIAYTPAIASSSFTVSRGAGNLFDVSEHDVAFNPGRLVAFVANDVASNALTGGKVRDDVFKDGLAKNVDEAARLWIDCDAVADLVKTKAGAAFTGTVADLQGLCTAGLDRMLAGQGTLLTDITRTSKIRVSGHASWTDTNCDLTSDRFQAGEYVGQFLPNSGDPIGITGSFTATRK